jgi:hypothetical protein
VYPFGCLAWFTSGERLAVVLISQKDLVHARTCGHQSLAYVTLIRSWTEQPNHVLKQLRLHISYVVLTVLLMLIPWVLVETETRGYQAYALHGSHIKKAMSLQIWEKHK